jgi:hypothetical protein
MTSGIAIAVIATSATSHNRTADRDVQVRREAHAANTAAIA